jgi:homospermidine synthase
VSTLLVGTQQFVDAIAAEKILGLEIVVEAWMAQVEQALDDPKLTTLGRMYAVRDVVNRYRSTTGKSQLAMCSCGRTA